MPDKRRFALQIQHLDLSTLSASYLCTEHCGSVLYVLAEGDVIHQQAGLPIHARVFAQSSHCLIKAETCALPFLDMLMRRTLLGVSHIAQQRPCNQIKQEGGTQQFWDAGWAGTLQLRTFVNIAKSLKARHAQLLQAHLGSLLGL